MGQILTNENTFSGTKIDLDGNVVKLTVGNNMSVNAGMSNSVYLGAKTQLIGGLTTNITIGPSANYTLGNTLSTTFGWSWIWAPINNTTYDVATRWGTVRNTISGGVSDVEYAKRTTEDLQGWRVFQAVMLSYTLLIGLTLIGMQWAPFEMVDTDQDGEAEGVHTNYLNLIAFCGDIISIIIMGVLQWLMTTYYRDTLRMFEHISRTDFTFTGVKTEVFTYPDKLEPTGNIPAQSAKAAVYMRPYPGVELPPPTPPDPWQIPVPYIPYVNPAWWYKIPSALPQQRGQYVVDLTDPINKPPIPDIELITTSNMSTPPVPGPFSQIFMNATKVSIGVASLSNLDDFAVLPANIAKRRDANGPNISLDPLLDSVTIRNMPLAINNVPSTSTNTITMGLFETEIRHGESVKVSLGTPGTERILEVDCFAGASLTVETAPMTSSGIIIDAGAKKTSILSSNTEVASFSPMEVSLTSGTNTFNILPDSIAINGMIFFN